MSEAQAVESSVVTVTGENRAEFMAHRMGLAAPEVAEAEIVEPVAKEVKSEPKAEEVEEHDEHDEEKVDQEKKGNPKLQKRFSELTKQREDARQDAARERSAREALELRLQALEGKKEPEPAVAAVEGKPVPGQFTDAFEYAEKLAEWASKQALTRRDDEEKEKVAKVEQEKSATVWRDRLAVTKQEMPDFDEVLASSDVKVSDQVRDAIMDSDVGPRILYHLAENPELADEISKLSVISALKRIGRLEVQFEKKEVQEEKKAEPAARVSKAPAPINPIKGGNTAAETVNADGVFEGSYSSYKALRKAGRI